MQKNLAPSCHGLLQWKDLTQRRKGHITVYSYSDFSTGSHDYLEGLMRSFNEDFCYEENDDQDIFDQSSCDLAHDLFDDAEGGHEEGVSKDDAAEIMSTYIQSLSQYPKLAHLHAYLEAFLDDFRRDPDSFACGWKSP